MKIKFVILFILSVSYTPVLFGQHNGNKNEYAYTRSSATCYDDKTDTSEKFFTKTELPPRYRGRSGFANLLTEKLSASIFVSTRTDSVFTDTVQVKFVIHNPYSTLRMSNLTISNTENKIFTEKLVEAIKQSACFWTPGSFSGREVSTWVDLNIYYYVKRTKNNVLLNVGYEMANEWRREDKSRWIE